MRLSRSSALIALSLGLGLVACSKPDTTPVDPEPANPGATGVTEPGTTPTTTTTRAEPNVNWVEEHVASGWFPVLPPPSENAPQADAAFEGRALQGGAGGRPAGEVPPDSREPSDMAPPPTASAPTSPAPRRPAETGGGDFGDEVVVEDAMVMDRDEARNDDGELEELERELMDGVSAFTGAEQKKSEEEADEPRTWRRSQLVPNATKIALGDDETLPLDSYEVTVRVDAHRARVVLDLTFTNPHESQYEGSFKLRVPDGAAVHFLAFGGNVATSPTLLPTATASMATDLQPSALMSLRGGPETLKEARMVPKEQAQRAYAAETARQIDPALLEWTGSGVFSASLFPIQPKGSHRVTVAYDLTLPATSDARELALDLPTDAGDVRATIEAGPGVTTTVGATPPNVLSDGTQRWVLDKPADPRVAIRVSTPDAVALVGDDAETGPRFAAALAPEIPATATSSRSRAVFVVDTSMSSNPDRMNLWLDLLEGTLTANRDTLREFAVLHFDVERRWWRSEWAQNDAGTVTAYLDHARETALEGATDLGAALREATAPSWSSGTLDADVFLYSDGAETWGTTPADEALAGVDTPVFSYTTSLPGTDSATLRDVARATGGAVFAVPGPDDVAAATKAHRNRPWTLRSVTVAGASDVLVAGRPTAVHPGQRLYVAGRGRPGAGDEVVLELEQDGRSHELRMPLAAVVPSRLAQRAYGEIATEQLEALAPLADAEARAYAIHHRVTGKTCSLLMLESEEAYERYEIRPDDEAAKVRANPVESVLQRLDDELARLRSDPRTAFVAWTERLERVSGVEFRDLERVRRAAGTLPIEAFELGPDALRSTDRSWDGVSGDFQEQLAAGEPTYDVAVAEAESRLEARGADDAIRAVSSLVEADAGSTDLLRDLAFSLLAWDRPRTAVGLLRRVVDKRPHEPETYRALAQSFERMGRTDLAVLHYELALRGGWDGRFGAFRLIAAMDYRRLIERIDRGEATCTLVDLVSEARTRISEEYLAELPDLVVTLTWNTDRTDVDLHVTDPSGETCYYGHPRTRAGGGITSDVTQGYGPEMFVLGTPPSGEYLIQAKYYRSDNLRRTLRSKVYATVIRHAGRPDESVTRHALLLGQTEQIAEITRLTVE